MAATNLRISTNHKYRIYMDVLFATGRFEDLTRVGIPGTKESTQHTAFPQFYGSARIFYFL
jgi:hypothetical protein